MNFCRLIACCTAAIIAGGAVAASTVDNVSVSPLGADGNVVISYTLSGDPAVVTMDVLKDDVSIGGKNIQFVSGAANRLVQPGERKIYWNAVKSWPGHEGVTGVSVKLKAWPTNSPPDYMVVSLYTPTNGTTFFAAEDFLPGGLGATNRIYKTENLLMRRIPASGVTWRMGSPSTEPCRGSNETNHYVTLDHDFYLSVFEITGSQYDAINAGTAPTTNGSIYATSRINYTTVRGTTYSWPDDGHKVAPTSFFGKLRTLAGGGDFDFPGEAEWEFACRSGTGTSLYNGKNVTGNYNGEASEVAAWLKKYGGDSGSGSTWTSTWVGRLLPNGYGLYDMLGNVSEWCRDWYADDVSTLADPNRGPDTGTTRVRRGGNVGTTANCCRAAWRGGTNPANTDIFSNGIRVWCSAAVPQMVTVE